MLKHHLSSKMLVFKDIGLTEKQVRLFYNVFKLIDVDNSDTITVDEFFTYFKYQFLTPLCKRLFMIFDEDKSGELSFTEFVVCTWNFVSLTEEEITDFAFQVYDLDHSGTLSNFEIAQMLSEGFGGKRHMTQVVVGLLEDLQHKKGKYNNRVFGPALFHSFVAKQKSAFWPIYVLHREMERGVFGSWFWTVQRKRRWKNNKRKKAFSLQRFEKQLKFRKKGNGGEFHEGTRRRAKTSRGFRKSNKGKHNRDKWAAKLREEGLASSNPHSHSSGGPDSRRSKVRSHAKVQPI